MALNKKFDAYTVGGSQAAFQLGVSLDDCKDKRLRRNVLRRINKFNFTVRQLGYLPDGGQREKLGYLLLKETKDSASNSLLPLKFQRWGISYSLFESVLTTALKEALRDFDEYDAQFDTFDFSMIREEYE